MHNLIILGSGRSGTSLAAGLFRNTGAHFGDQPLAPSVSNTNGYFEDYEINDANNRVISEILRWKLGERFRTWFAPRVQLDARCWWMATPRRVRPISVPQSALDIMQRHFCRRPFCLKDPRFSTTLSSWQPHLPTDTRFVVVFRRPDKTVDSMLRDAVEVYHPPLPTRPIDAWTAWHRVYSRLLYEWSDRNRWLFLDYEQLVSRGEAPQLERFTEASLNFEQVDPKLSRAQELSRGRSSLERHCWKLFDELVQRAELDQNYGAANCQPAGV